MRRVLFRIMALPFRSMALPLLCMAALFALGGAGLLAEDFPWKIWGVGSTGSVDVSTSTLTKVPSGDNDSRRTGIWIDNPDSNTAAMRIFVSSTTSLGFDEDQVGPEIIAADAPIFFPIGPDLHIYALSLHSSSEAITYQELR